MIDDKKIEKACEKALNNSVFNDGVHAYPYVRGFYDCAKWAFNEFRKDLWHPASEEPDVRHKTIICLYEDGHICQDYDAYDEATESDKLGRKEFKWNYYAEDNEIKKWCYATDLLPKKGGEQ